MMGNDNSGRILAVGLTETRGELNVPPKLTTRLLIVTCDWSPAGNCDHPHLLTYPTLLVENTPLKLAMLFPAKLNSKTIQPKFRSTTR